MTLQVGGHAGLGHLDDVANDGLAGEGDNVDSDVENITGGAGKDTLTGSNAANTILGGGGSDTIFGQGGSNTLDGGPKDDTIHGGTEGDTLIGGPEDDKLYGDDGVDTLRRRLRVGQARGRPRHRLGRLQRRCGAGLREGHRGRKGPAARPRATTTSRRSRMSYGSAFDDTLTGDAIANTISGFEGNDKIDGGGGPDHLFGGVGNDSIRGGLGDDEMSGGPGTDTADFAKASSGEVIDLSTYAASATGGDGFDWLPLIENIIGSGKADTITGSADANVFKGGGGDDSLLGLGGDDTLSGDGGWTRSTAVRTPTPVSPRPRRTASSSREPAEPDEGAPTGAPSHFAASAFAAFAWMSSSDVAGSYLGSPQPGRHSISASARGSWKKTIVWRRLPAASAGGTATRWSVAGQRSFVQRAIMSPRLTTNEPGTAWTSTHSPARVCTCRPPGASSVRRIVMQP